MCSSLVNEPTKKELLCEKRNKTLQDMLRYSLHGLFVLLISSSHTILRQIVTLGNISALKNTD